MLERLVEENRQMCSLVEQKNSNKPSFVNTDNQKPPNLLSPLLANLNPTDKDDSNQNLQSNLNRKRASQKSIGNLNGISDYYKKVDSDSNRDIVRRGNTMQSNQLSNLGMNRNREDLENYQNAFMENTKMKSQ